MVDPARRRATYEDVLGAPVHLVTELIDGVLHTSPRPASRHAHSSTVLGIDLGAPFQRGRGGPGGWVFLDEPELHVGGDILVPDLAAWRRERMPELLDVPFFTLAPDWVCEVLSPSTHALDRARKRPIYARERVPHVWFIDPLTRTLEVFQLAADRYVVLATYQDDERVRAAPFDAIELDLAALWSL